MLPSEELKKELREIAEILNQFKSEAVQLRVLDMLTGQESPQAGRTVRQKRRAASGRRPSKEEEVGKEQPEKQTRGGTASRASGGGAHSIIVRLLEEGFFDTPQTIGQITRHASERLGHRLKANECSPSLLRLLRAGRLTRSKNNDGQYEYSKEGRD
jgi:hypothetical protein